MKKSIIIMMLMTLCSLVCKSQSITIEDLKGGVWYNLEVASNERDYYIFTDSVVISTYDCIIKGNWESVSNIRPYYLIEELPDSLETYNFDFSKVGKNTSGKYFVEWNEKMNQTLFYQIVSFSEESIVRKGIVPNYPFTLAITYKRRFE